MACKSSADRANSLLKQYATVVPVVTKECFTPAIEMLQSVMALADIGSGIPLQGIQSWKYRCYETFLLEYGMFFRVPKRATNSLLPLKSCFEIAKNCQSSTRIYCEGFVIRTDGSSH